MREYGVFVEASGPKGRNYGEDGYGSRSYESARRWFEGRSSWELWHLKETYGIAQEVDPTHQILTEAIDKVLTRLQRQGLRVEILDAVGAIAPDPDDEGAYFAAVLYAMEEEES